MISSRTRPPRSAGSVSRTSPRPSSSAAASSSATMRCSSRSSRPACARRARGSRGARPARRRSSAPRSSPLTSSTRRARPAPGCAPSSAPGSRRFPWTAMADVRFEQATRIYPGNEIPAVDGLDLHVADGEFMVLVGPSGSGKTPALRMLAGLEEVDAGSIHIGDRDVTDVAPKNRDVAMVFQNYALYPYLTVADNIGFPLKVARVKKDVREQRVREVAKLLGLE